VSRPNVLFISPDAVGERMSGLGIRYTELARALASDADVTLATGDAVSAGTAGSVSVLQYDPHAPADLRPAIERADAIVAPPQWPLITRWMRRSGARLIFDLYDPETLETLELFASRPLLRRALVALTIDRLEDALRSGHHFMCASESQRDLWIGALLAVRLLTPTAYDRDPTLRGVLDRVPFGVPAEPPVAGGPGIRAAFPQIGPDDEIVLWNGGVWRWLDPVTAVRAIGRLAERRPGVRLVFMGAASGVAGRAAAAEARALAAPLGDTVLFNEAWVPYAERAPWLLEADCALVTAVDHLETRFAFRTRMLDCFWAGLPVVCTRGDELAARVERDRLGAVVTPGDHAALADAIVAVLDRGRAAHATGLSRAAADHRWPVVAEPLRRWVAAAGRPRRLGDGTPAPARRPLHRLRSAGYLAARHALESANVRWPSL
jgi:glycosyltransferase involved in cell wall biosynthesis